MMKRLSPVLAAALYFLSSANIVAATGGLNGLPILNGPVPPVPQLPGMKQRIGDFIHPGLWHTHDDLERIKSGVEGKAEPWHSAYANFTLSKFSQANVRHPCPISHTMQWPVSLQQDLKYTMRGPRPILCRGPCSNYTTFTNDVRAAYQNALMWYITRSQDHWNKSAEILDAWGSSLTDIIGTDTSLLVGLEGDLFANAAEIMRWEGGWVEKGARAIGASGFSNQLYWLFARQSINIGQANYGMVSIKALLSFAVYLDDVALVSYANAFSSCLKHRQGRVYVLKYTCFVSTIMPSTPISKILALPSLPTLTPRRDRAPSPAETKDTPRAGLGGQPRPPGQSSPRVSTFTVRETTCSCGRRSTFLSSTSGKTFPTTRSFTGARPSWSTGPGRRHPASPAALLVRRFSMYVCRLSLGLALGCAY